MKQIEEYIIPKRHRIKWPNFDRNTFIVAIGFILSSAIVAIWIILT